MHPLSRSMRPIQRSRRSQRRTHARFPAPVARTWPALALLLAALLSAPALGAGDPATADDTPPEPPETITYTVREGDNPWRLSEHFLGSPQHVLQVLELNDIQQPQRLQPGSRLVFPRHLLSADDSPVSIAAVAGETWLRRPSVVAQPLRAGLSLAPGDQLGTGEDGAAVLNFFDGTQLHLGSASALRILRSESYAGGRLSHISTELTAGEGQIRVPTRGDPNRRFELITPAATTSVRGTEFRARVDADGRLREEVSSGATLVANALGASEIPEGRGLSVTPGEAPGEPVALLDAPDLSALPERFTQRRGELRWPAIPGAAAWRLQVAADADFLQILRSEHLTEPRAELHAERERRLYLRIAALDDAGLLGRVAEHSLLMTPAPATPELIEARREAGYGAPIALAWRAAAGADSYRVQLSGSEDFSSPLLQRSGAAQRIELPADLPPGEYHWRVIAVTDSGRESEPGSGGKLRIRAPRPAPPETFAFHDRIVIRWPALPGVSHYEVQLAADEQFTEIVDSGICVQRAAPLVSLPRPADGDYFVRLRAVYPSGAQPASGDGGDHSRADDARRSAWSASVPRAVISHDYRLPATLLIALIMF